MKACVLQQIKQITVEENANIKRIRRKVQKWTDTGFERMFQCSRVMLLPCLLFPRIFIRRAQKENCQFRNYSKILRFFVFHCQTTRRFCRCYMRTSKHIQVYSSFKLAGSVKGNCGLWAAGFVWNRNGVSLFLDQFLIGTEFAVLTSQVMKSGEDYRGLHWNTALQKLSEWNTVLLPSK